MSIERNEAFDEMLDDAYPTWVFGDYTFYASDIIYNADEILYREALRDWQDANTKDGCNEHHIERGTCLLCGKEVTDEQETDNDN